MKAQEAITDSKVCTLSLGCLHNLGIAEGWGLSLIGKRALALQVQRVLST